MARTAPQHTRLRVTLRSVRAAGGLLPFGVYVTLFLLVPAGAIVVGAFRTPAGHATLGNVRIASRGVYRHGFVTSIELSLIASILPAILGVLLARAIDASPEESVLRRVAVTASGVFANFGGVPLAFIFISTLGNTGLATGWLNHLGLHLNSNGFSLYTLTGVAIVYLYFQIPLMVLVSLPALQGLKPEWREASKNLGGGSLHYWRHIAAPALAPSVLGATLLLFGSAFSAYATADALTSGSIPLTSIQIGSFLNGNVIPGQENVGKALGFGMILVIAVLMGFYTVLQRRASRWAR
jgi:putative spermidine/putrescine transport system permease protein